MNRSRATLVLLVLTAAGALGAWALTRPQDAAEPGGQPNFLIVDIDTLSWDHVGLMRDGVSNTPNLDALGTRGARFTQAISHSGWTLPALGSILTGTQPVALQVQAGSMPWRAPGVRDLPGILALYGYGTFAFWGRTLAGPVAGFLSPGFQHATIRGKGPATDEAAQWLSTSPPEPFFAYVHEIDLHSPLGYSRLLGDEAFADAARAARRPTYGEIHRKLVQQLGEAAAQEVTIRHYDATVQQADAALGRILAALESAGLSERTVVIVTSDHGEDLFEHANVDHGLLYDSTIKVPLVVSDPGMARVGLEIGVTVQGSDLAPSLLARAGIPADAGMDGRSLLPLLGLGADGDDYVERGVFSLTDACHASWREGGMKVILRDGRHRADRDWYPAGGANGVQVPLLVFAAEHSLNVPLPDCVRPGSSGELAIPGQPAFAGPGSMDLRVELYDLEADPGEHHNLVNERPEYAARLVNQLLLTMASGAHRMQGAKEEELTREQIEKIREQGYWGLVSPGGE